MVVKRGVKFIRSLFVCLFVTPYTLMMWSWRGWSCYPAFLLFLVSFVFSSRLRAQYGRAVTERVANSLIRSRLATSHCTISPVCSSSSSISWMFPAVFPLRARFPCAIWLSTSASLYAFALPLCLMLTCFAHLAGSHILRGSYCLLERPYSVLVYFVRGVVFGFYWLLCDVLPYWPSCPYPARLSLPFVPRAIPYL